MSSGVVCNVLNYPRCAQPFSCHLTCAHFGHHDHALLRSFPLKLATQLFKLSSDHHVASTTSTTSIANGPHQVHATIRLVACENRSARHSITSEVRQPELIATTDPSWYKDCNRCKQNPSSEVPLQHPPAQRIPHEALGIPTFRADERGCCDEQ